MAYDEGYDAAIHTYMTEAGRPVTMSEIAEAVGMSRAAAYQWRDRHSWELRAVGKGRHGADAWVIVAGAKNPNGAMVDGQRVPDGSANGAAQVLPDVDMGEVLTVNAIRTRGGRLRLDLAAGDRVLEVEVIGERMAVC